MKKPLLFAGAAVVLAALAVFLSPRRAAQVYVDKDSPDYKAWRGFLAGRRAVSLDRLHLYTARGQYPLNVDFEGRKIPYFIDAKGTPCAVGALIIEDGFADLARAVAAQDNHVRVADLKEGPVVDWLLTSGLLQEEAARIQPHYGFMHMTAADRERKREVARVRSGLIEVERALREETEASLDFATGRLLYRLSSDPKFVPVMRPGAELPPRTLAPFAR